MAKRTIIFLIILFFLLVAVGITTSHLVPFSTASILDIIQKDKCQNIPAGNYDAKLKTYAPTSWEITCPWPGGKWSGKIAAKTIPFGYRWIPTIRKGDKYNIKTTLKEICATPINLLGAGWNDICKVCQYTQYIDCSKVKVVGKVAVDKISCLLGAYQADGKGNIDISYQGGGLGSCSAKAAYTGKLTGILTVQKAPKEQACINSGGTVSTALCCKSTGDFPNTCLIGACGCSPENSHEVKICNCAKSKCFDGNQCVSR